jgi:hypothetical protein
LKQSASIRRAGTFLNRDRVQFSDVGHAVRDDPPREAFGSEGISRRPPPRTEPKRRSTPKWRHGTTCMSFTRSRESIIRRHTASLVITLTWLRTPGCDPLSSASISTSRARISSTKDRTSNSAQVSRVSRTNVFAADDDARPFRTDRLVMGVSIGDREDLSRPVCRSADRLVSP